MAICLTFGTQEFTSMLEEYRDVRAYCYNCQHWNGICVSRWPWFTVCFVPVLPLSIHKYREVTCQTCRFTQDLRDRPDITPSTRPPPGYVSGIAPQPPPQAHGGYQPPAPPQEGQGGYSYK
ncbi:hypothetical protein ASPZODRAFT_131383 [Penicilliopsis zonata CBS 506.65]|uniref:Zinc-ribbon 15 domain-containing protein n=1 Tax=Penicilliopsis zonata CBS 506.65 TaxID=1073090 RepID=A0A1L9SL47_9EURO|nr:hypothetical protein ASPZODRAFT_131383 [Penicilliopsis zonata CBS 506.65]OJJ47804.1 hypothetical protein ASPZODRAFT_131383 [Penicilliopsis zonata CBS 506.65]